MLVQVIPSENNGGSTANANANASSDVINASKVGVSLGNIGFQIICTSLSAADGTVYLEHSNDGTNFSTVDNSTLTLASGSSNQCMILTNQAFAYYRVSYSKGSNASGTYKVILNFN